MKGAFLLIAMLAGAAVFCAYADADSYPGKYVSVIVAAAPGGPSDIAARVLAKGLTQSLAETGAEMVDWTPEQFTAFDHAEALKWTKVVKDSGATIN